MKKIEEIRTTFLFSVESSHCINVPSKPKRSFCFSNFQLVNRIPLLANQSFLHELYYINLLTSWLPTGHRTSREEKSSDKQPLGSSFCLFVPKHLWPYTCYWKNEIIYVSLIPQYCYYYYYLPSSCLVTTHKSLLSSWFQLLPSFPINQSNLLSIAVLKH